MPELTRRYLPIALLLSAAAFAGPAVAQKVPTGNVTVELFALATNGFDPVVEAFNKQYPNITVKLTKFGTDEMKQALRVGASSGKMPDIWFNWGGSLASALQQGRARARSDAAHQGAETRRDTQFRRQSSSPNTTTSSTAFPIAWCR